MALRFDGTEASLFLIEFKAWLHSYSFFLNLIALATTFMANGKPLQSEAISLALASTISFSGPFSKAPFLNKSQPSSEDKGSISRE